MSIEQSNAIQPSIPETTPGVITEIPLDFTKQLARFIEKASLKNIAGIDEIGSGNFYELITEAWLMLRDLGYNLTEDDAYDYIVYLQKPYGTRASKSIADILNAIAGLTAEQKSGIVKRVLGSVRWDLDAPCKNNQPSDWEALSVPNALGVCATCPVMPQCLEGWLSGNPIHSSGVVAGLSTTERQTIEKRTVSGDDGGYQLALKALFIKSVFNRNKKLPLIGQEQRTKLLIYGKQNNLI